MDQCVSSVKNIDEDIIQRVKVGAIFLLQIYKVSTGTLLALFVPQSCGEKVCTLTENYHNDDPYHKSVLYFQMFSWLTFFMYYIVEIRREEWAIKYLDIDNDKPDNALKEIIVKEPILDKKMDQINLMYLRLLVFNCFIYFLNLVATIKLLKDGYHSMSTISCFASFVLLVLMKLFNSLTVAYQSVTNDKMMSAYMCEFVSFNVLDKDYVEAKEKNIIKDLEVNDPPNESINQEEGYPPKQKMVKPLEINKEIIIPDRDNTSLEDITPILKDESI